MSTLPFWKMHGAGNDFVVAAVDDADDTNEAGWSSLAVAICDRHVGVGADGLILALPSDVADRRMRIFNADGSEAEMCVNGIRCFVKYCLDRGLVTSDDGTMTVETIPGVRSTDATFDDAGRVSAVRVVAGTPDLDPASLGVSVEQTPPVTDLPIEVSDARGEVALQVALVSMGNPHAVQFVEDSPDGYELHRIGPLVETLPLFTRRTNFEVVRVLDRSRLEMRVWERGVGETQACGSGACAAVVAARTLGRVDDRVEVALPGGVLSIQWGGSGDVILTGPAVRVFEAEWER